MDIQSVSKVWATDTMEMKSKRKYFCSLLLMSLYQGKIHHHKNSIRPNGGTKT